ncbi:hypothetical protein AMS68_002179 [Peltaster fructicola]|uniref:Ino eighty subunit 1 n=1 Tax=Peltaster fructicola TaxID=286661 RepID=A0A6H0XPH1_9PEZI|nr:hypothetical protein AMS68_002179 [Peltaster fructicola]
MSSLQHILASEPSESKNEPVVAQDHSQTMAPSSPMRTEHPISASTPKQHDRTTSHAQHSPEQPATHTAPRRTDNPPAATPANASATGANGLSSVYTGNKMRHLKKEDGIPLWRKDIQYDFLRLVFYDTTRCFTKYSEKTSGFTFAEVYIDAMAKSSKCSKILKEKLLSDTDGAISMAMVCLLVNLGRMNTTLNFFPEMRAQLRTYHSIPALQAHQDPNAYKQLQDAPRLKSILKGATEDEPQPWTMEDIRAAPKPRTNAVNLIFVMSQFAPKVSDMHFPPPRDFYDLIMRPTLSSESRARAFLWLLWWYLESDFSYEDSQRNPFGVGLPAEGAEPGAVPTMVPALESLTEEQADKENVDTEEEKIFGEVKRKDRIAILASDPSPAMIALKRARNKAGNRSDDEASEAGWYKGHGSKGQFMMDEDNTRTRSPSPYGRELGTNAIRRLLNADDVSGDDSPASGRKSFGRNISRKDRPKVESGLGQWQRGRTPDAAKNIPILPNLAPDASVRLREYGLGGSPGRDGGLNTNLHHVPTPSYQAQKRNRGVTQHQSALNIHRRAQMDYMLDRSIRKIHVSARQDREEEGAVVRAWKRIRVLPADYDSEEELIRARKVRDRDKDEDYRGQRGAAKEADEALEHAHRRPKTYLGGFASMGDAVDEDVGEEVKSLASTLRKVCRRLDRWQDDDMPGDAMIRRRKREARYGLEQRARARAHSAHRHSATGMEEDDSDGR